jgi:hypothetical protein
MKRTLTLGSILLTGFALLVTGTLFAQDDDPSSRLVHVQTLEASFPSDGSVAERDSLWEIFFDRTVMKNEKILSQRTLGHFWGANSNEIVLIREYANWDDINTFGTRQQELINEAWPDSLERQAFFQSFNRYFGPHKDEIYQQIGGLRK